MRVTNQQVQIMEALACYQYLTAQQMADIGISSSAKAVRNKSLPRLKNHHKRFIDSESFGVLPTKGRLPDIYFLTKKGVELLADALGIEPTGIRYPVGGVQFNRDYFHRIAFIDFHINFRRWARNQEKDIEFFNSYFEMIGSQRKGEVRSRSVNRFQLKKKIHTKGQQSFIPDGITRYQDGDKRRLLAIEIHNGNHSQRITEELLSHTEAIAQGLLTHKFDHGKKANHILSVHENQVTLDSVRSRLMAVEDFAPFLALFHFNLQSQVKIDFAKGWTLADGSESQLF